MERETRRLTLFDLAVLIVAAALVMAALRWLYPDILWQNVPSVMLHKLKHHGVIFGLVAIGAELELLLLPAATILCFALLGLILKGPRPRLWRHVWSRPGNLACLLVAVVTLTAYLAPKVAVWLRGGTVGSPPYATSEWPAALAGVVLIVGWTILGLTGRWRPERSWIDRAGRAIGLTVTAGAIFLWLHVAFNG
jgi:hypothetical protein